MNRVADIPQKIEYGQEPIVNKEIASKKCFGNWCCMYVPLTAAAVTGIAGMYLAAKALYEGDGACPARMPECNALLFCSITMSVFSIAGIGYLARSYFKEKMHQTEIEFPQM